MASRMNHCSWKNTSNHRFMRKWFAFLKEKRFTESFGLDLRVMCESTLLSPLITFQFYVHSVNNNTSGLKTLYKIWSETLGKPEFNSHLNSTLFTEPAHAHFGALYFWH